jgi:hypothetical protein
MVEKQIKWCNACDDVRIAMTDDETHCNVCSDKLTKIGWINYEDVC